MMEFLRTALDRVLHLNVYLPLWADEMGPWVYLILFAVIFCETGLVVTPILPGDSLLFAVGAVIALPTSTLNLPLMLAVLIAAAVLGDAVNYYLGFKIGPAVFRSEKSWLFNKKHLLRTQQFYEKYGGKTIILARFMPIIRTFAPFVAGIGKMEYRRFFVYNATGGAAWVLICVLSGYYFGGIEFIQKNFELVIVAIVLISVMPMVVEFILARRRASKGATEPNGLGLPDAGLNGTAPAALETAIQTEPTAPR
jgi:membrane-associated protein